MKSKYSAPLADWLTVLSAILICMASFSTAIAQSNSDVEIAERPGWVNAQTIPKLDLTQSARAENGVYYQLLDTQSFVGEDYYEFYRRTSVNITNRSGLEDAARLQFSFDPADQDFTIHSISIIRDGETFDRLDAEKIEVFRQEEEINVGVTDGDLTVYFEIPSVRVGDTVDYEVSWRVSSEIWPSDYFRNFSVEWSVPVGAVHERIILPSGKNLSIKNFSTKIEPVIQQVGDSTEYSWLVIDPEIVEAQDAVPVTFDQWGQVAVSTIDSWAGIVDSLQQHYNEDLQLPSGSTLSLPEFDLDESLEVKITNAIRFVQNEIRYVADETGVGSHLPRKPVTVLERGWGDCKDKSLLLVAILRSIGVEAHVALTDYGSGYALDQRLPSPYEFNHAITVIIVDGIRYWIDPTDNQQGGIFPNIAQPAYGFGLPLTGGNEALWPIDLSPSNEPEKIVHETIDFEALSDSGLKIEVVTTLRGREADSFRRSFSSRSNDSLSADYLKYYRDLYPGLEASKDLSVVDNFDTNEIVTSEQYILSEADFKENDLFLQFPIQADTVRNLLTEIVKDDRTASIALPYPKHLKHIATIKNTGFDLDGVEDYDIETSEFIHRRKTIADGDKVDISFDLKILAPEAPISRLEDYFQLTNEIGDYSYITYNLDGESIVEDFELDGVSTIFFVSIILSFVFFGFAIWGAFRAINSQNENMDAETFYPVRLTKFIILNVATFGLYGIFWMFRCWRWERYKDQSTINPFWRSFFSWLWFIALYGSVRGEFEDDNRPPYWLGVLLAIAYFILTLGTAIASSLTEENMSANLLVTVIQGFIFLLVIPLLIFVNQLNAPTESAIARNSSWTPRTFVALLMGVSFWVMMISVIYLPV